MTTAAPVSMAPALSNDHVFMAWPEIGAAFLPRPNAGIYNMADFGQAMSAASA
jgi:hypothetical protein